MRRLIPLLPLALLTAAADAEPAPFDLAGPALGVSVTRAGRTLPIAEVPALAVGDTLAIRPDLPADQAARYVLIVAFLRGSTNPPPEGWFAAADLWRKRGRDGLRLTVPAGAEQVAVFLAPATGGDFRTLRGAVRGKPGAFVRATQELRQAALDRQRLDAYLAAVRAEPVGDPAAAATAAALQRTLQVKVDPDCFLRMPALQAACLQRNQESLVLNDGHNSTLADMVTGSGADLALQFSYTPQGGLGTYSPYVSAIRDVIGILGSIGTARYQYFPAIGVADGDRLRLLLNAAPSFHNPKSVLVTALPAVAPADTAAPRLPTPSALATVCADDPRPLLPLGPAPLLYATRYARDLAVRVALPDGGAVDLPATADAGRGGLALAVGDRLPAGPAVLHGRLRGWWGFQPLDGPPVDFLPRRGPWTATTDGPDGVRLTGGTAACVTGAALRGAAAGAPPLAVVREDARTLRIALPADHGRAGPLAVAGPPGTAPELVALPAPPTAPAPEADLVARAVERAPAGGLAVTIADDQAVPADATLAFSLRLASRRFTGQEVVELAAGDGAPVALAFGRELRRADAAVAVARVEPAVVLGASAFGPLRARVVRDGVAGGWVPLGPLVRLPRLRALTCPATGVCRLAGEDLFLLAATAATADFAAPLPVPDGYPATELAVPRLAGDRLFVRLRDDPAVTAWIDKRAPAG